MAFAGDVADCCCWDALANSPHSEPDCGWIFVGVGLCDGDDVGVFGGGGAIFTPPGGGGRPSPTWGRCFDFDETSLPSFF